MADQENLTEAHWTLANPQRIEDLVELGLVQLSDLPWLKRALIHMQAGMYLPTPERQIFYTFISRLFTLALDDPTIFRLIRQRIIMSKYKTHEEVEMQEGRRRVKSLSGPDVKKAPEGMLDTFANIVRNKKIAGGTPTDSDMAIASRARSELRRRRRHMGEAKDPGEYDFEGSMAKTQLRIIIHNAQQLHDMLDDETNLPEWVQSKITLAKDHIVSSANYMQAEMKEDVQLDELKKSTLGSYVKKASINLANTAMGVAAIDATHPNVSTRPDMSSQRQKLKRRIKGIENATSTLTKEDYELSYQERLEIALEDFGISSLQEITPETQAEFLQYVENINTLTGE